MNSFLLDCKYDVFSYGGPNRSSYSVSRVCYEAASPWDIGIQYLHRRYSLSMLTNDYEGQNFRSRIFF